MYLLLVAPAPTELTTHPHDRVGTPASTTGTDPVPTKATAPAQCRLPVATA
jgi:hypothetical protein